MKKIVGIVAVFLVVFAAAQVYAYSISIATDPSETWVTSAFNTEQTMGNMMAGMAVTVYFATGGFETEYWAATGTDSGGVSGTGWSLVESDNTFSHAWTFTTSSPVTGFFIDAAPGDTVFDTRAFDTGPDYGTPGSARGTTFNVTSTGDGDIIATYVDMVALEGSDPVGDVWRALDVQFSGIQFPETENWVLQFVQDTDNIEFPGDLQPLQPVQPPQPVPEPATLLLLGAGLAGFAAFRKTMH
jgi:hypothetical protein